MPDPSLTHGAPPPLATGMADISGLAALPIALLLFHTGIVSFGFLLRYYDAENAVSGGSARPSLPQTMRAWAREWWYGLTTALCLPFALVPRFVDPTYRPGGGPVIVLVRGYMQSHSAFFFMYWRLRRRGYENVHSVRLGAALGTVETAALHLQAKIRALSNDSGKAPIIAIAHGFGGLVVRYCLQQDSSLPIERIVCLGTPHHGSRAAVFCVGAGGAQMRCDSPLLATLATADTTRVVSYYSALDNFVLPAQNAILGAEPRRFDHCGHTTLLFDAQVVDALLGEIASFTAQHPNPPASPQAPPTPASGGRTLDVEASSPPAEDGISTQAPAAQTDEDGNASPPSTAAKTH